MSFLISYCIFAVSCVFISAQALLVVENATQLVTYLCYGMLLIAWFAPLSVWLIKPKNSALNKIYNIWAKSGYFLFGSAFILLILLIIRGGIWFAVLLINSGQCLALQEILDSLFNNKMIFVWTFILAIIGYYNAKKMPKVLQYSFANNKIKKPLKILIASDLHIDRMLEPGKIKQWVNFFNSLKADVILLPGDIGDDVSEEVKPQIKALKKLSAKYGIFYTLGNHEAYFNPCHWEAVFASLGWVVLHNSGVEIADSGIYVAGVPDRKFFPVSVAQAVQQDKSDSFRILLAHLPLTVKEIKDVKINLQVSGHTHGGQIFPFNLLAKLGNGGFLGGKYKVKDTTLLVSRGVGCWGPKMRLFAPSDVIVVDLQPKI